MRRRDWLVMHFAFNISHKRCGVPRPPVRGAFRRLFAEKMAVYIFLFMLIRQTFVHRAALDNIALGDCMNLPLALALECAKTLCTRGNSPRSLTTQQLPRRIANGTCGNFDGLAALFPMADADRYRARRIVFRLARCRHDNPVRSAVGAKHGVGLRPQLIGLREIPGKRVGIRRLWPRTMYKEKDACRSIGQQDFFHLCHAMRAEVRVQA